MTRNASDDALAKSTNFPERLVAPDKAVPTWLWLWHGAPPRTLRPSGRFRERPKSGRPRTGKQDSMTDANKTTNQPTLLFSPIDLRGVTLRNGVMISPMAQYSANEGVASDWHIVHLGKFGLGGARLVFTEATAVQEKGRITYGDLGLYNDEHVEPLRRVTEFIKKYGAVPGVQLWHARRKASICRAWEGGDPLDETDAAKGEPPWETVGPIAVPGAPGGIVPRAVSGEEIEELKQDWRAATRRSLAAGFEVVEVHGAHGYLLH